MCSRFLFAVTFFLVLGFGATPWGTAQDAGQFGADDLSEAVRNQDLDSYWLEQRKWAAYGYRPQIKGKITSFDNLPSYSAHKNYYSYGGELPQPTLANPYDKKSIQLTKYGTWH